MWQWVACQEIEIVERLAKHGLGQKKSLPEEAFAIF
jgi:hypothetical protein